MAKLLRMLGTLPEDRRKMLLMAPIFLLCGIAEMLNYNGFMTLFNQRLGSQYMPYLYMAEAFILPLEAALMSRMTSILSKPALMRDMFMVMLGIVSINAAVLLLFRATGSNLPFYYFFLFLSSSFVVRQQTILLWSLAIDLCPTQQAKRLMPIFVSSALLGGIAAGGLAQLVSVSFGSDYVYMLGVLFLIAGGVNYRKAIKRYLLPLLLQTEQRGSAGQEEQVPLPGMEYIRRSLKSPFLLCAAVLMALMPALYFLMEYQFLSISHLHYTGEASFGAFFGRITMLMFILAFLLQLVSARLSSWMGQTNMLVAIAAIFAASFAAVALTLGSETAMLTLSVAYMFIYVLLYYFAEPSQQLFFKLLPLAQRDGYRYVITGFSTSAGILLGALLQFLHTGFGLGFLLLPLTGTVLSILLVAIAVAARRMYRAELIKVVSVIRTNGGELAAAFDEFLGDAGMLDSIRSLLGRSNDYARELALRILARSRDPQSLPLLLKLSEDHSTRIRVAALQAMNFHSADLLALVTVASYLEDKDYEVRAAAVKVIGQAKHLEAQAFYFIRLKLLDSQPLVVAEAVRALYALGSVQSFEACYEAVGRFLKLGGEHAVHMARTVADLELYSFLPEVKALLQEYDPAVRCAAITCLGRLKYVEAIDPMLALLPISGPVIRKTTIEALGSMGVQAIGPLREWLTNSDLHVWNAAASALTVLLEDEDVGWLAEDCIQRVDGVVSERGVETALRSLGREDLAVLAALRLKARIGLVADAAWTVMGRLSDDRASSAVRSALESGDEELRDNGHEVLSEGFGHSRLSSALLALSGREEGSYSSEKAADKLQWMIHSGDEWLWAFAAHIFQEAERDEMNEEPQLMGLLDKVVFLKQTLLFSDLPLEDLGHIANIAHEELMPDGTVLMRAGEDNNSIYVVVEGGVGLRGGWSDEATVFGVLGEHEVLGDSSALGSAPSSVTAIAQGEVKALKLNSGEMSRLIRLYPEIGFGLLQSSFARVRMLEEMMIVSAEAERLGRADS